MNRAEMLLKYYNEEDVVIYWDEKNNWIYADWRNQPSVQTVKNGGAAMLDLLKSKKASKVLNDNSNVTEHWSAASQWAANVWFPKMIAAGLQKFAWIQSPHTILSQFSAEKSEKRKPGDIICIFDDRSEAERWLKED